MSQVAVFLAEGMEEVEAVTPIDFLRRAGIEVITVGVTGKTVTGAHNIPIVADTELADFNWEVEGLIFPGGIPGSSNLAANETLLEMIRQFDARKKLVAAICATPALVLGGAGVLEGRSFTCFPGLESKVGGGGHYTAGRIETDGNMITGCGAGGAAEFSAALIAYLKGKEAADKIMKSTLQPGA
jgi:protein deglycase